MTVLHSKDYLSGEGGERKAMVSGRREFESAQQEERSEGMGVVRGLKRLLGRGKPKEPWAYRLESEDWPSGVCEYTDDMTWDERYGLLRQLPQYEDRALRELAETPITDDPIRPYSEIPESRPVDQVSRSD